MNRKLFLLLNILVLVGFVQFSLAKVNVSKEIKNLKSKKSEEKLSAIGKLGKANTKEARAALIQEMRTQKNSHTKTVVIEALSEGHDSDSIAEVKDALKNGADADIRRAAAYSLGYTNDASVVPSLIESFLNKNEDVSVRSQAGSSLAGYNPSEEIYKCFLEGLRDESNIVRIKSMSSLSRLYGNTEKVKITALLKTMLADKDDLVRKNAQAQIDLLTGVTK